MSEREIEKKKHQNNWNMSKDEVPASLSDEGISSREQIINPSKKALDNGSKSSSPVTGKKGLIGRFVGAVMGFISAIFEVWFYWIKSLFTVFIEPRIIRANLLRKKAKATTYKEWADASFSLDKLEGSYRL